MKGSVRNMFGSAKRFCFCFCFLIWRSLFGLYTHEATMFPMSCLVGGTK